MIRTIGYYFRRLWWVFFAAGTPMTTCLVMLNVIVFILQLVWSYHYHSTWLTDTFALSPAWFNTHQYWQIISYAWLHAETLPVQLWFHLERLPLHLAINMIMVFCMGREIEWFLGPFRLALLYLGGCLAAGLAWIFFDNPGSEAAIIGASGAAFALITAFAAIDPHRKIHVLLVFIFPLKLTIGRLAILLVASEALMIHFNYSPEIAHTAHLGGAAFGWLMMKLLRVQPGAHYPLGGPVTRL